MKVCAGVGLMQKLVFPKKRYVFKVMKFLDFIFDKTAGF